MLELLSIFLFFLLLLFLGHHFNFTAIAISFLLILVYLLPVFRLIPVNFLILDAHLQLSVDVRFLYLWLTSLDEETQFIVELMY